MPDRVPPPRKVGLTSKTIVAPVAAFTMACILYVYTRSSIQAAKRNAQMHRDHDGGQINWQNENLRRHGMMDSPNPQKGSIRELVEEVRKQAAGDVLVEDDSKKKPKRN